jgi:hypothetical protein
MLKNFWKEDVELICLGIKSNDEFSCNCHVKTLCQEDRYAVTQNRTEINISHETGGEMICCKIVHVTDRMQNNTAIKQVLLTL